jgi:hypothetical protein
MEVFDIREAYRQVFGYKGLPFPLAPGLPFPEDPFGTIGKVGSALLGLGQLNTPYFMRIKVDGKLLPNEPMIELGFNKTMIRTPIVQSNAENQRRGTVKELYGMDDYAIRIRGLIINEENENEFPEDDVRWFRNMIEKQQSVSIECTLTTLFNINLVAINGGEFPYDSGYQGMQRYELRGYSDDNVELEITEEN